MPSCHAAVHGLQGSGPLCRGVSAAGSERPKVTSGSVARSCRVVLEYTYSFAKRGRWCCGWLPTGKLPRR
eukprot:11918226-Prorocentrum_lima.AAC.1